MASNSRQMLKRADPSTIHDKFLVGYQGWFTCAGDGDPVGPGHHGWLHWFNFPIPDGGRPNTDLWPDVSSYSPSELFPAPGLKTKSGEQTFLFSSRNAKTVQRHFHWMAEHGVDGAFLQRFAGECDVESGSKGIRAIRDEVGERVREAAEREGRVFAIMYDVSGVPADRIQRILQHDWVHLVHDLRVLDSPNYLREKGKPVIALWGFGFQNSGHNPDLVREITKFFRNTTPGGVYIMGGTPAHWRTGESDADRNPEFLDVWLNEFDAISPWTVGRYRTEHEADNFAQTKMKGDWELITNRNQEDNRRKVDYIPVVLPGGSGYNLSQGEWGFNDIKREGGRFLWKQIYNARRLGVRTIYGAMWDEYDEGTAFMPVVEHKQDLPVSDKYPFLSLDEDGFDVPSDWYMRICGFAAEGLRNERRIHETFPVKELQDYWSSRPRYQDVNSNSEEVRGSVSSNADGGVDPNDPGGGQTYEEWLALQKEEKEEVPPPPYTLESGESTDPIPPQTVTNAIRAAAVTTTPEILVRNSPAVANVQPVASSSHSVSSSSHTAPPAVNVDAYPASATLGSQILAPQLHPPAQRHSPQPPAVNVDAYPASATLGSQILASPQLHPPAQRHSPQPPAVNVDAYPASATLGSQILASPQLHPTAQRHSPQPRPSPGGVHHQQSVPPQGHSPRPYPPAGVSQHPQSLPPSQSHSHQPYPPASASGQPAQSYASHAGLQHPQPYAPVQPYLPTPGQGQQTQFYPAQQGYPTSPGQSQGYAPTGAPSQGYTSPNQPSGDPGYPTVDIQSHPSNYNTYHQSQDSVAGLANEFGRQSISGPSASGRLPSPPPLHPAHPNYATRPSVPTLKPNRPQSQTGRHSPSSGQVPTTSTNRPRWPPAEWDSDTPPVPQFGRRPSAPGLTRPQRVTASSYSSTTLRPTVSMSARPTRPTTTGNTNMPSAYYSAQPPYADNHHSDFSFPTAGPPMHDGYVPFPAGPQQMPSGYADQTGTWPGSGGVSPAVPFPGGPTAYNVYGESQYPGGPTFRPTSSPGYEQFHHFPEAPGGGAYFGSNMGPASSAFPTPNEASTPPHSSTGYHSSSSSRPPSSGAFAFALSAVDKVAGRKARDQLESQVDNITHNKLFNKLTK